MQFKSLPVLYVISLETQYDKSNGLCFRLVISFSSFSTPTLTSDFSNTESNVKYFKNLTPVSNSFNET